MAPSPTGALHLGNARSFLLAWLSARSAGGKCYLRIEDIDSPRVKPQSIADTIETLKWLGLDWDPFEASHQFKTLESQASAQDPSLHGIPIQSQHLKKYQQTIALFVQRNAVYACDCTRSQVQSAASAPHESLLADVTFALDSPVYPETCRLKRSTPNGLSHAWRWKFSDETHSFVDRLLGKQSITPRSVLGDFVVAKKDGTPAYQLAVIVDDYEMGVTEVVRGDDLVASTFRQVAMLDHLGWRRPSYCHVPLMIGSDGRRLAKRHGDTRVDYFRRSGCTAEAVVGFLAHSAGLIDAPEPIAAASLIASFDWANVRRETTVVDQSDALRTCRRLSA